MREEFEAKPSGSLRSTSCQESRFRAFSIVRMVGSYKQDSSRTCEEWRVFAIALCVRLTVLVVVSKFGPEPRFERERALILPELD